MDTDLGLPRINPMSDSSHDANNDDLNPFGVMDKLSNAWTTSRDSSCHAGSEIVLRRIVKKLFHQINQLQPSELDDEYIYQAPITYNDYLGLSRYSKSDQPLNCASLNKLENILSNFISNGHIKRPMHTSLFTGPAFDPFSAASSALRSPTTHLLIVLFIVSILSWFLRNVNRNRSTLKSWVYSIFIVGFVEFCMHKNELTVNRNANLERCRNPDWIARLASFVNYDYDNCRAQDGGTGRLNIAMTGIEYLSELFLQPIVHFGSKSGKSLESYLNSFTGLNYIIAPLFPMLVIIVLPISLLFLWSLINRLKPPTNNRTQRTNYNKAITAQSPTRSNKGQIKGKQ